MTCSAAMNTFLVGNSSSDPPISRLLDELLVDIFSRICLHPISITVGPGDIWDIQQVCKRWRRVVRGTPTLWSTFNVGDSGLLPPRPDLIVDLDIMNLRVQECLLLSKMAPLSISFLEVRSVLAHGAYTDVADHANRWLSFTVTGELLSYMLASVARFSDLLKRRGLAELRALTIKYNSTSNYGDSELLYDIFQIATALEEVFLVRSPPAIFIALPWTKVRILTIEECNITSGHNVVSVFCAIPSLEVLKWKNNFTWQEEWIPRTQVTTHSSLHSLTVEESIHSHEHPRHKIWSSFHIPSLTELRILKHFNDSAFLPVLRAIQDSANTVKNLYVEFCSDNLLLNAVKQLPNIEELSLTYIPNSTEILSELIWKQNTTTENLLPYLRRLKILLRDDHFIYSMVEFMRSRSMAASTAKDGQPVSPLEFVKCTVVVCREGYDPESSLNQLKCLGEELGIKFEGAMIIDSFLMHQRSIGYS
ncbi:hypothetical protein BDQ17DRAFT_1424763 [Cyathus striatus]|nr:hypothetical protein BDQ17DRAFT_1424763 [Cyathus striatus]